MAGLERRVVTIPAGRRRPYDAAEWHGTVVVLERGRLDLELVSGAPPLTLGPGAVLWLGKLSLRALHARGSEAAVLVATRRR